MATWSIAVGIFLAIMAVIAGIISYFLNRKYYPIAFITGIGLYIFSVFYTWDIYSLDKNKVMLLLFLSTIVIILIGYLINKTTKKKININKELYFMGIFLFILLIIILIYSLSFSSLEKIVNFYDEINLINESYKYPIKYKIGEITFKNPGCLPKVYEIEKYIYCYNNNYVSRINYGDNIDYKNYYEIAPHTEKVVSLFINRVPQLKENNFNFTKIKIYKVVDNNYECLEENFVKEIILKK